MRTIRLMLGILGGLALQPAFAAPGERPESRQEARHDDSGASTANEAARIAQQQQGGGRVLAVDRTTDGYRVKLLHKGDVHIVIVPYGN